jgi:dCMP deaminase
MRPDWDEYFLNIASVVADRADCKRRKVGAVLVNSDHIIIGTGYNGTRPGKPGCLDGACPRGNLSYAEVAEFSDYSDPTSPGFCISTHAEVNALLHTTQPVQNATIYVSQPPCPGCFKVLDNAGMSRIVFSSSAGPGIHNLT